MPKKIFYDGYWYNCSAVTGDILSGLVNKLRDLEPDSLEAENTRELIEDIISDAIARLEVYPDDVA